MTQSVTDFERTFARAWTLLVSNPIMIVPPFVLGLLGGVLSYALSSLLDNLIISGAGNATVGAVANTAREIAGVLLALLVTMLQMAFVTGMAGAAWRQARTSLGDGWSALTHRGLAALGAIVLLFLIGFCAAALAPVTFWISLLAYMVFFIYTMAAVIIGGRGAIGGIVESAQLALANIWPSIGIVALIAVIAVVGAWLGDALGRLAPLAGGILSVVLQQVIIAYAVLVVTGEYLKLREQAPAQ